MKRPFVMDALVVLQDHLHCIWRLPDGDDDFSTRWRLIRRHFSLAAEACGLHPLQSGETWICPKSEGLAK